jgi:hypothetical protein
VDLEYSREEVEEGRGMRMLKEAVGGNQTQPMISPMKTNQDKSLSADLLQLQRTTPINNKSSS